MPVWHSEQTVMMLADSCARPLTLDGATIDFDPNAAPMYLSGATAKAGCWKPVQRAGACAFTLTGWTCAHATRPPNLVTEQL